jgi:uncharacterized membrane protein
MKGKAILMIIGLVGSFILQSFTEITWLFPLVAFIIFIYILIKVIVRIAKSRRGDSGGGDDENGGYFDIWNA